MFLCNFAHKQGEQKMKTSTFIRKQALILATISLAKMEEGSSRFFEAKGEIVTEEQRDPKTNVVKMEDDGKTPLMISTLHVVDLESGEEGEIVIGFLVVKALEKLDNTEGVKFEMVKGVKKGRTVLWTVYLIDTKK